MKLTIVNGEKIEIDARLIERFCTWPSSSKCTSIEYTVKDEIGLLTTSSCVVKMSFDDFKKEYLKEMAYLQFKKYTKECPKGVLKSAYDMARCE